MSDDAIRQVLGLLYQEDTLKVLAALVLGGKPEEESGLDREAVRRALDRLERGGLAVRGQGGEWGVRRERFRELLHATARPAPPVSPEERVLQSFLVEGRLRAIPTKRDKQLVVLDYVAQVFEAGGPLTGEGGQRRAARLPRRLRGAAPLLVDEACSAGRTTSTGAAAAPSQGS